MAMEKAELGKKEKTRGDKASVDQEHLPTQMGVEFITRFYRLLKGTSLYDRKNFIIDRLTQDCLQMIQTIIKSEGHLFLKVVRDNFFFNNIRIQVKADRYPILKAFLQELRRRWIGEVEIMEEMTADQLKEFVFLLSGLEENNESNYLYVKKQLEFRNIDDDRRGEAGIFQRRRDLHGLRGSETIFERGLFQIGQPRQGSDRQRQEPEGAECPKSQAPHAECRQRHHAG